MSEEKIQKLKEIIKETRKNTKKIDPTMFWRKQKNWGRYEDLVCWLFFELNNYSVVEDMGMVQRQKDSIVVFIYSLGN